MMRDGRNCINRFWNQGGNIDVRGDADDDVAVVMMWWEWGGFEMGENAETVFWNQQRNIGMCDDDDDDGDGDGVWHYSCASDAEGEQPMRWYIIHNIQ